MSKITVYTDAPEAYDYGRTKTIRTFKHYRMVEIDGEYYANYQIGRYQSGMYMATKDKDKADELSRLKADWLS